MRWEVGELLLALHTGSDDRDHACGENACNRNERDVGDFLKRAGDRQTTTLMSLRGLRRDFRATYRKETIAMIAAHAMLQIAWDEILLNAMLPDRACEPARNVV